MSCDCLTSKLVGSFSQELWEKFTAMKYDDVLTLEIKLPECKCTDENCFDYGTRRVIEVRKTEMVEVDPYYCEEKDDVVDKERKPGLEFYEKHESWHEKENKWNTNIFGEKILFRLQFNEKKRTIKVSHYKHGSTGWDNCDKYPSIVFQQEMSMLNKFLSL